MDTMVSTVLTISMSTWAFLADYARPYLLTLVTMAHGT